MLLEKSQDFGSIHLGSKFWSKWLGVFHMGFGKAAKDEINGLTTKGKFTGNHGFSHEIWDFPVIFPLN